jgi:thiopurine S-methyltransferase
MGTDWLKRWEEGNIRFHQNDYHPQLVKFGEQFSPGTVLVPLCGKTLDMIYLISKGHSVIGVELSLIACRDFFEENKIEFTEKSFKDFVVFESERVSLWCGDFFKLPQDVWDKVSGIYDRAALVALPKEIRQRYAEEINTRPPNKIQMLLISYEYPEDAYQGPPFSVPESEIVNLYNSFKIKKLHIDTEDIFLKNASEATFWLEMI